MNVIKRSGIEKEFDIQKIKTAITKANSETNELTEDDFLKVINYVLNECHKYKRALNVEEIQEIVENSLMKYNKFETAKAYIKFRYQKTLLRKQNTTDKQILATVNLENEEVKQENANKNPILLSTQRDYIAGLVSKDLTNRYFLPKDIQEAHETGLIHFHDADYFVQKMHNCDLINLDDMLQNGTVINGVKIEKPHKLITAMTIATQIITACASSQYGGCSVDLSDLAPFVRDSYNKYLEKYIQRGFAEEDCVKYSEQDLKEEISAAVQTFNYQINSMSTTNGQAPFITVFMYLNQRPEYKKEHAELIEEFLNQRILGLKNEKGVYITQAFPKLIYVLENDNVEKTSDYYYLTELSATCTAKRMVPDYISEKVMKSLKHSVYGTDDCYAVMGCRSALTPDRFSKSLGNISNAGNYIPNIPKYAGRFNQGVVTLNLVDIACSSKRNIEKFRKIFEERCELAHKALRLRHEHLLGTPSDVAPILWQYGALARLGKGETIDKLLYNGYSTLSLGYAGLWETVYYMLGKKLTEAEGKEFGLEIMRKLNEYTEKWKKEENIDYSIYGTPLESTTFKLAKCLQKRFGIIKGVTDKNYITNSYHVHVTEPIDAFSKLKIESEFQKLSPGGAISYVEVPNMQNNIPAVLSVINFIYDNIMYAELNTKSDYCHVCGYDGEIQIIDDKNGKHIWRCPQCGNTDHNKMNVARRTCGYIGTNDFNQGRLEEIKERVLHL